LKSTAIALGKMGRKPGWPITSGLSKKLPHWPRSGIASVTRREVGIFIIGIGLGLLLSLAVVLEVMLSLRDGTRSSGYAFDKIVFLLPAVLLLAGVILFAYRRKYDRTSN
jgi:hypothetical protein